MEEVIIKYTDDCCCKQSHTPETTPVCGFTDNEGTFFPTEEKAYSSS